MVLSAPLLTRKRVIEVVLEAEKGTKEIGTLPAWVEDLVINPTAPFEPRPGTGLYRGHKEPGVLGERSGVCSFRSEMRGVGLAGMEATLAALLQACGLKKAEEVYQVHSVPADDKCLSIDVWEDGVKKGLAGAAGNVIFEGEVGKRLFCAFELSGVWQAVIDEALPAYTPSSAAPMLLQGGTFTLGGESIKISRFRLNMGCIVTPRLDINAVGGIAHYQITDYDGPILEIDAEADKVAGYDFNGLWLAGTTGAVSLIVNDGTEKVTFAIPAFQYREMPEGDRDGIQIYNVAGQCNHDSGDDCVSLTAAAVI